MGKHYRWNSVYGTASSYLLRWQSNNDNLNNLTAWKDRHQFMKLTKPKRKRKMIKVNLNDCMLFKITEYGEGLLPHHFKKNEDGWYRGQIWEVMEVFGPHMCIGCNSKIELNVLIEQY